MYIPLNENELLPVVAGDHEITLLVKPFTGANEYWLDSLRQGLPSEATQEAMLEFIEKVFDHFCKGYRVHDEKRTEHLFTETEKPRAFFGFKVKSWLVENIRDINSLSVEEKKI